MLINMNIKNLFNFIFFSSILILGVLVLKKYLTNAPKNLPFLSDEIEEKDSDEGIGSITAGSAFELKGNIYVLTVFISEGKWSYKNQLSQYDKIFEAQNWLRQEAKRYNTDIHFINGQFGLEKPIFFQNIEIGSGPGNKNPKIVIETLKKVGYNNPKLFTNWVKNNTNCTNSLVLILANESGRGYAVPYMKGLGNEYFAEGCILSTKPLMSSEVAHEFLHLFGAWDLYETLDQTKEKEIAAKRIYPDDIMLRTAENINELKIDKLTAWLIGINPYKEEHFDWFCPYH